MKFKNILETIGHSPHVRLQRLFAEARARNVEIWLKQEGRNPGGSIKDRIALAMIEDAERRGLLDHETRIIEPTSGNTGIGLAMVAAVKGYRLTLVMPESMSIERRKLMAAYGAELELTPKEKGMKGAIERAAELCKTQSGKAWMPMQFENPANPEVHARTTAKEIVEDFPSRLDFVFAGVGTGGHISGCGRVLKQHHRALKLFAVEPSDSPVLSGGKPSPHPLQGIGAGFVPKNYDATLIDGVIQINKEEAYSFARRLAREEGIFVGVSSGAVLAALQKKQSELPDNSIVLVFAYDTGERYLSVPDLY